MFISWWVYFVTGLSSVLKQPPTAGLANIANKSSHSSSSCWFWLILLICINLKAKRPFDVLPCGTRKSKSPCRPQWDKFCWRIGWFLDDFTLLRSCFFTFYPFLNNRSRLNRIFLPAWRKRKELNAWYHSVCWCRHLGRMEQDVYD